MGIETVKDDRSSLTSSGARLTNGALRLQSDERLVDLARDGYRPAFETIVRRYGPPLKNYCGRIVGGDNSQDVVQQTFINAYTALRSDRRKVDLKPWLYRIAHNQSINMVKKNGWEHDQIDENFDGVPQPADIVERRDNLKKVVSSIGVLPSRQRSALVSREFEGRSYGEIATRMGESVAVVRELIRRARVKLRNGAGMLIPVQLLRGLLAGQQAGGIDTTRISEVLAGAGAGGALIKLGTTVLVAGTLATGTGVVVLDRDGRRDTGSASAPAASIDKAMDGTQQAELLTDSVLARQGAGQKPDKGQAGDAKDRDDFMMDDRGGKGPNGGYDDEFEKPYDDKPDGDMSDGPKKGEDDDMYEKPAWPGKPGKGDGMEDGEDKGGKDEGGKDEGGDKGDDMDDGEMNDDDDEFDDNDHSGPGGGED